MSFKRKFFALVMGLLSLFTANAFEYNGLYFNVLDESAATCSLYASAESVTHLVIPEVAYDGNKAYSVVDCATRFTAYGTLEPQTLVIPESVTNISSNAFEYCNWIKNLEILAEGITIGYKAFKSCEQLETIKLPSHVTEIKYYAFSECNSLTEVDVPDCDTAIYNLFDNCSSLRRATLHYAPSFGVLFENCPAMEMITVTTGIPVEIGDSFSYTLPSTCALTVPADSWVDYIYSKWNNQFSTIYLSGYDKPIREFNDGVFEYKLIPDQTAILMPAKSPASYKSLSEVSIPNRVIDENNTDEGFYKVTVIGKNAFKECYYMKTLTISKNCTKILDYAFYKCTALKTLTIPDAVEYIGANAFQSCSGLVTLNMGKGLKYVEKYGFSSNNALETVNISDIDAWANIDFIENSNPYGNHYDSSSKEQVATKYYFNGTLIKNIVLKEGLKKIGDYAFMAWSQLESITLPESLESIGNNSFRSTSLTEIIIPDSVRTIGDRAFMCMALSSVKFGKSVEEIGVSGFSAEALTAVSLPYGLKRIGEGAFRYVKNLVVPASVEYLGSYATAHNLYLADGTKPIEVDPFTTSGTKDRELYIGRNLTTAAFKGYPFTRLVIGNLVTTIPADSYADCQSLTDVRLGASLEEIGDRAFQNVRMTTLIIPALRPLTIGENAFSGCRIEQLAIGPKIKAIGEKAFDYNTYMKRLCVTAINPPSASNNTFSNYSMPLYLISKEAYDNYIDYPRCWYRFEDNMFTLKQITDLTCNDTSFTGQPGNSFQLNVKTYPSDADLSELFYYSTDPNVAIVDNNGLVTIPGEPVVLQSRKIASVEPRDTYGADADNTGTCKIIACTMYPDSPVFEFTVNAYNLDTTDCNIIVDDSTAPVNNDIYTLQGICVVRNATAEDLQNLSRGVYIYQGKKYLVR